MYLIDNRQFSAIFWNGKIMGTNYIIFTCYVLLVLLQKICISISLARMSQPSTLCKILPCQHKHNLRTYLNIKFYDEYYNKKYIMASNQDF